MVQQMIEGYRVSPLQRRLWLLQNAGDSASYRARAVVRVEGNLDSNRLQQAIGSVVSRHEALRTTFHTLPGISIPVQVVGDGKTSSETAPRCQFLKTGDSQGLLQIDISALCADAASLALVVEEISQAYHGVDAQDDAPSLQYADVAEWLNELSESENPAVGPQHWREKIPDLSAVAVADAGFLLNVLPVNLTKETVAGILAHEPQGFLLAAWVSLLDRLGYETTSRTAVVCDGRSDERLREVVGLLTRNVPVSLKFDRNTSFDEARGRATREIQEAAEWQEYFSWSAVGEENSEIFYFPYSFEFLDLSQPDDEQQEVRFTISELNAYVDRFGIQLSCRKRGNLLDLNLHWDEGRHAREEVQRLADSLAAILADAAKNPDTNLGQLNILSSSERRKLEDFNPAPVQFANQHLLLHELITAQADLTPTAVAVKFEEQTLTYRELSERSDRVAAYLTSRHVGPDVLVGICLERSLEMVIALLGVLKTGGAYLPVDPHYPSERIDMMLRDSNTSLVITQPVLFTKLRSCKAELLEIEKISTTHNEDRPIFNRAAGENAAYVLYTSGSTGVPKGVVVTHGGLVNHMLWMEQAFPLDAEDRILQKTPFSFDASVWEFYAPLMSGATLVMAEPGGHRDRNYLLRTLRDERITTLQLVPLQLDMLLEGEGLEECESLRRVFCGGEPLTSVQVKQFYERVKHARLYNLYGPTETTIQCTVGECTAEYQGATALIGRPISNTQVHILDSQMNLVPVGVLGEIYIGGAGVGRGYLHRPELTAERYVPDPFSRGARLYRTGDLGRYLDDGQIDCLGRVDQQVKVRGHRIELGEVEAALREHEGVKEAVVVRRADRSGEGQLVGYVVWRAGAASSEAELRAQLRQRLPDYMVPSVFVWLEQLPLMPNGKVDRQALPAPGERISSEVAGPRTVEEELLCGIFSEVLELERVGRDENFFELGGHSLLATRVISQVRRVFGVELSLRELFEDATVAGLATRVKQARTGAAVPPLVRRGSSETPLSFAQQRLWFLDQLEPGSTAYNLALGVRLNGRLDKTALRRALGEVVRRHEVLRSSFPAPEGLGVQRVTADYELVVEEIELGELGEREVERHAALEAATPFDLSTGPVLRVKLLVLAETEHVLLVTMHHIVSDGWSLEVLVREFSHLYERYVSGAESELPELAVQYGDYALWQREWLRGEVLEQQLGYWRKQLADVPVLQLPTDRPYPPIKNYQGESVNFSLNQRLTQQLRDLSRSEAVTLFMTLLAAFDVLLSKYSGQQDIAVGTGIANRNRSETEGLIGFFVNALVLRVRLEPELSFRELLKRVRETTLEAYQHQDVPFEKVMQDLYKDRDLSRTPLFQVMLISQSIQPDQIKIPGMTVSVLESSHSPVRTDLDIYIGTREETLTATLVYDSELFEVSTIQRMIEDFKQILETIVAQPDALLSELFNSPDPRSLNQRNDH